MKVSLLDLGFHKGSIYETIVTTFDSKRRPHVAPMGVTISGANNLILRPFLGTETFRTLNTLRCGVVNVTSDPWRFYKTALKNETWVGSPPRSWFEPAKRVIAPRLKSCDSYVEFAVTSTSGNGPRRSVRCRVVHVKVMRKKVAPYCRSMFAAIECIIHATRIREFQKSGASGDAGRLIELMEYYEDLVERVSPRSVECKIIHSLLRHLRRLQ